LLLIAAGLYLINEFRRSKQQTGMGSGASGANPMSLYRTPPPSVIQSNLESPTGEFARADRRYDR
jgi:hypothetical protein